MCSDRQYRQVPVKVEKKDPNETFRRCCDALIATLNSPLAMEYSDQKNEDTGIAMT